MFYFAHFSILFLGYFLGFEWSRQIYRALGRPEAHMFRAMCISLGVYLLVVGSPLFSALEVRQEGARKFCFARG
jgi:hypothetical protein